MAKRSINRIKYKLWDSQLTTEFDGGIDEGIYYAAFSLSIEDRRLLIEKLNDQQAKALEAQPAPASA